VESVNRVNGTVRARAVTVTAWAENPLVALAATAPELVSYGAEQRGYCKRLL